MKRLARLLRAFSLLAIFGAGLLGVDTTTGGVTNAAYAAPVGKFFLTIKNQGNQASVAVRMTLGWNGIGVVNKYITVLKVQNDGKRVLKRVGLPGGSVDLSLSMKGSNLDFNANLRSITGQVLNKKWKLFAVDSSKILVINGTSVF
ncbi:MAG: hypothetical protein ACTSX7_02340 [Alphaproteobacteria bacterium]